MAKAVRGVLLDITGVLYESGGGSIPGSIEAVQKIRQANLPLRFCTNETQILRGTLLRKLLGLGFHLSEEEILSPAAACCSYLREHNLRPYLIVHPKARPEYEELDTSAPNTVVLGDAVDEFSYQNLNKAFQILMEQSNRTLITLGQGKYYKEGGRLVLDVGPFAKALEYATGVTPVVIGKPSSEFFMSAVKSMGVLPENVVMVGDDVVSDVGGAKRCGMRGILVRTGKYRSVVRPSDEEHPDIHPDKVVDALADAVEYIVANDIAN